MPPMERIPWQTGDPFEKNRQGENGMIRESSMENLARPGTGPHITNLREALRRVWVLNRPLAFVGILMSGVLAVALVGLVADPRVVTGAPAWLKPAKFAVSISIYCFTLLWLMTFVNGRPRLVRLVSWVTAAALVVEMVLIAGAALSGATSHFNVSTPLHAAVWNAMALFVVLVWIANLLAIVLLLVQRLPDPAFAWSLRLGMLVASVGMVVAFFMTTGPTPEQLAADERGEGMPTVGAHSVGVEDGGPGLPITGWSTVGGDLRVPHFLGLHGAQALPLIGFLLARFGPGWLRVGHRVALVWTAGVTYLGLVVLLTWQALRGQPVISPDATTLGALLALFAAAGVVVAVVMLRARSRGNRPVVCPPVVPRMAAYSAHRRPGDERRTRE